MADASRRVSFPSAEKIKCAPKRPTVILNEPTFKVCGSSPLRRCASSNHKFCRAWCELLSSWCLIRI